MGKFNKNDLKTINQKLKEELKMFLLFLIIPLIVLIGAFTIPITIFSRRARYAEMSGTLIDQGILGIAIVAIVFLMTLVMNYKYAPFASLLLDKIVQKKKIEHIPVKGIVSLAEENIAPQQVALGFTHAITYDSEKISSDFFNEKENPHLLKTTTLEVYVAKFSKIILYREFM